MLFNIERYVIRTGTRYLRRCFSKNVDVPVNESQEFVQHANDDFQFIHREGKKSLKIAILGAPNVGKSTIINQLMRRTICPTSSKVHTTRTKAEAIFCENDTQLIFVDTPGIVSKAECKRYNLASTFSDDPKACAQADIVGIVQDAQNIYTRHKIDSNVLELCQDIKDKIPLILIFNKVDKLKQKEVLLQLVDSLTKKDNSLNFSDIFMISALTGDGIDDLRTYLLESAKPQDWQYKEDVYSDRTCEDIIEQTVRAKLMDCLPQEIPYKLPVTLEHFDPRLDDSFIAVVSVTCPNNRIMSLFLRNKGKRVKTIAIMAEEELRNAFRTPVRLMINIKGPK